MSLYDFTTGSISQISTVLCSVNGPNLGQQCCLAGRPADTLYRLMHYNIDTHTSQQLIDYSGFNNIRISGNDIVWDRRRTRAAPTTAEIFHYSLVTGVTTSLTTNSRPDLFPEISAGNVVWQSFDTESTSEIFRRNIQTGITQAVNIQLVIGSDAADFRKQCRMAGTRQ